MSKKTNSTEAENIVIAPKVEIVENPAIKAARENGMPVLSIVVLGQTTEVVYTPNMRFADFMRHNGISDNHVATPLYNEAKAVHTAEQVKRLESRVTEDIKQSAKWKDGGFVIESSLIKRHKAEAGNETDSFLIKAWAHKKALESQKAQERASMFLASVNPNVKHISRDAGQKAA